MHCNLCGLAFDALDGKQYALPCLHLFCQECAQKQLEHNSCCTQCGTAFSARSAKVIVCTHDPKKHELTLCGASPEVVMQSALSAMRCYVQQVELSGQIRESKLQRRAENLQSQCEAKLSQVYDAYTKVKVKAKSMSQQLAEANSEKEELHSKYQQRQAQIKQLKAQMEAMQRQQPMQAHPLQPMPQHSGGHGMQMMQPMSRSSPSGGMGGLQAPGPGHMITTVQQRTQYYNMDLNTPQGLQMGGQPQGGSGGMKRPHTSMGIGNQALMGSGPRADLSSPSMMMMPGQGGMQQQNRIGGNNLMQPLQRMGSMGKMPLLGGPPQQMRRSGGILQPSQRGNILGSPGF